MTRLPSTRQLTQIRVPRIEDYLPQIPGLGPWPTSRNDGPAPVEPITPEEEKSLLRTVLGPIQWLGETIAKPFRATQGVVSGLTDVAQGKSFSEAEWGGGLLNLVPFSDTMGLTNPEDMAKTGGRNLLGRWGIAPPDEGQSWAEDWPWKLAGLGVDLLTPGVGLASGPGSALTAAGKAVAKAGKVPRSVKGAKDAIVAAIEGPGMKPWATRLAEAGGNVTAAAADRASRGRLLGTSVKAMTDEVREGLRGTAAISPLGGGIWGLLGLTRKIPVGVGSEAGAKALETLSYGRFSPFAWLGHLASRATAGTWPGAEMAQRAAAYSKFQNIQASVADSLPVLSQGMNDLEMLWTKIGQYAKAAGNDRGFADADDFVNYLWELRGKLPNQGMFQGAPGNLAGEVQQFNAAAQDMADALSGVDSYLGMKYRMLGGNLEFLKSIHIAHSPRRPSAYLKKAFDELEHRRQYKTSAGGYQTQRELTFDQPGGTHTVNALATDPWLSGTARLSEQEQAALANQISQTMGLPAGTPLADAQRVYAFEAILKPARQAIQYGEDPETLAKLAEWEKSWLPTVKDAKGNIIQGGKGDDLITYLSKLPENVQQHGLFDRATVTDWLDYLNTISASTANLLSVHNLMRQTARIADKAGDKPPPGYMYLDDAWAATVFQKGKLTGKPILNERGKTQFLADYMDDLVREDPGAASRFGITQSSQNIQGYEKELVEKLGPQVMVPEKLPGVLGNWFQLMEPESHSALGMVWDRFNNLFKTAVTAAPAFFSRNVIDDMWRQLANAQEHSGVRGVLRGYLKTLKDLWRGPSPEMQEAAKLGLFAKTGIGQQVASLQSQKQLPITFKELLSKEASPYTEGIWKGRFNPLNVRGFRPERFEQMGTSGAESARQFIFADWAKRFYSLTEALGRMPTYYAALEAGRTPSQAKALVEALSFGISKPKLAAVPGNFYERVISRVIPFSNFVQKNIPYQLAQLIDQPAGLTAQTIRGLGLAQRASTDYIPSWMREQLGIRLGGEDEEARFFRGLGLSYESLGPMLPTIVGNVASGATWSRTAERMLSQAAPPIQAAYKLMAKKDPYTGRQMKYLKGPTGVPLIDTLLTSGPTARAANMLAESMDKRKGFAEKALALGLGMRLSRFDLPEQQIADTEQAIKAQIEPLKHVREWTEPYVPKKYRDQVAPETLKKLRQLHTLAKKRKLLLQSRPKPSPVYGWGF